MPRVQKKVNGHTELEKMDMHDIIILTYLSIALFLALLMNNDQPIAGIGDLLFVVIICLLWPLFGFASLIIYLLTLD